MVTYRARGRSILLIVLSSCLFLGLEDNRAAAGRAINYRTTWTDANGREHTVLIQGTAEGGKVVGTLNLDGVEMPLAGTVAGDAISGSVSTRQGALLATFSGTRGDDGKLRGDARWGTATHAWELPAATVDSMLGERIPATP